MSCGVPLQGEKAEDDAGEQRNEEDREQLRLKKLGKDPTAKTDFLPDKEREAEEEAVRAQLRKEYELRQKVRPVQCKAGLCQDHVHSTARSMRFCKSLAHCCCLLDGQINVARPK